MASTHFTPGQAAVRLGCQPWHVSQIIRRGLVPYSKAGRWHLIAEGDMPALRRALLDAGYIKAELEAVAHAS